MDIRIPKIIKPLDMGDYTEEMKGVVLQVWVNPPVELIKKIVESQKNIHYIVETALKRKQNWLSKLFNRTRFEKPATAIYDCWSDLLSHGDEKTRISPDEVRRMIEETFNENPDFWPWLQNRALSMIDDYRKGKKKP